ncbi:tetratricopeptide repeat protein [Aeromicrobium erythreum]|uniref:tetratricopeptide repeat protein n=1 Tax=Aeromicrobium erythreum TaxID=2041 RepID=UPI000B24AF83|nr:tetratricopeptide repeat protein [Aeromicrobium erythreum]
MNQSSGRGPNRPRRPAETRGSSRPGKPSDRGGSKPADTRGGKPAETRGGGKPADRRGGKPADTRGGGKPADTRGGKPGERRGGKPGERRGGKPGDRRGGPARNRDREERTVDQQTYDGPPIPDDIAATDLDRYARDQLSNLPAKLADRVARHLIMAGLLLDEDPETAYAHALAARARAPRNALIREACGETAYAAGHYAQALAELRAARRINGQHLYAPIMADCERALGRPTQALTYDTPTTRNHLDQTGNIELTIVIAGARRDLGQHQAALQLLQTEPLHTTTRAPWATRLKYTYADTLHTTGNTHEALQWFHRVIATDPHHTTDAPQRITQLEHELAAQEDGK